jgi:hypothetical protein
MDRLVKLGFIVGILGFVVYLLGGMAATECYVDAINPGRYSEKYKPIYNPTCGDPSSPYRR